MTRTLAIAEIARQHSCLTKIFGQGRECNQPCKTVLSFSLITMQNLVL